MTDKKNQNSIEIPEIVSHPYQHYPSDQQSHETTNDHYPTSSLSMSPSNQDENDIESFGKIRVKSNENLFENYNTTKKRRHPTTTYAKKIYNHQTNDETTIATIAEDDDDDDDEDNVPVEGTTITATTGADHYLPSSLKFNENSMTIFVTKKPSELTNISENDCLVNSSSSSGGRRDLEIENPRTLTSDSFNSPSGYENIICSPNFIDLSYSDEHEEGHQDDVLGTQSDCEMIDFEGMVEQSFSDSNLGSGTGFDYGDVDGLLNFKNQVMAGGLIGSATHHGIGHHVPNLIPFGTTASSGGGSGGKKDNQSSKKRKYLANEELRKREKQNFEHWLNNGGPPPNTFVLRNPRGNQPRTYNTDALWAALVDVKAGESIYR